MLKERDPSFLPEALSKQQRRIDRNSQHRRGDRLRNVVMIRKFFGVTLKVNLKTGVARLRHDVVVRQVKLVQSFYVNGKWSTTQADDALVQLVVARHRREIVERQVGLLQCR